MEQEIVATVHASLMGIVFLILLMLLSLGHGFSRFWRWLKGSRASYYMIEGRNIVESTPYSLRTRPVWPVLPVFKYITGSVVEVNRGPFRRRSAIYGDAAGNWEVVEVNSGSYTRVGLRDLTMSLPVESALRLINTYPSLQAMLDEIERQKNQIVELEKQLEFAEKDKKEWTVKLRKLVAKIIKDKQRFRSQAVQEIRESLEGVLMGMEEGTFDDRVFEIEGRVTQGGR